MPVRLVLDSSVLVAAMKHGDRGHADATAFLDRLRFARSRGDAEVFAPPELWLEARVAAAKAEKATHAPPPRPIEELFAGLDVELVPMTSIEQIDEFLDELKRRVRDQAPFANATDLVFLWVAWRCNAALVTLDGGLLKYHGMVCDVMRPFHVRFR